MDLTAIFQQLGISLGLGLLVGLQRERVESPIAGVRTFPLVTILGTVCALLGQTFGGWVVVVGFAAVAAMIYLGNTVEIKQGVGDPGLTTEIAILLMFGVGAYLVIGHKEVAITIGGGVAVLLQFKGQMHGFVAKLGNDDLKAIMQFALISLVVLPILPNRSFGPYEVLNPRQIWWMVVLIVGVSLGGYIAYKFLGEKSGILLGGILGGLVSSTATTVSYAKRTAKAPANSRLAAVAIMIASTIVFARLLVEIAIVAPAFLAVAGVPILAILLLLGILSATLWFRGPRGRNEIPTQENPTELKPALLFGLIYAFVLFATAAAREHFGHQGLYVVAGLAGLTDVDAITLSTSRLVNLGRLSMNDGWKLIVIASMSNLVFKAATIALIGHPRLLAKIAPLYCVALVTGVLLLTLW
jgi:uncharacterized membrane protein (DUF4010 family)